MRNPDINAMNKSAPFGLRLACALWMLWILLFGSTVAQAQFTFATNNGALTLTSYTGSGRTVTIPGLTNGLPVVAIGEKAFLDCAGLVSITIPNSITNFGVSAFDGCTNLLAVFFQGNSPENSPLIGAAAGVFSDDPNVTLYYLQGTTGWEGAYNGLPEVQWNPDVLNELIYSTNDDVITITGYSGAGGAIAIPSVINSLPVGCIAGNAFFNCASLTGITFPNTLTNLGDLAFADCTALTGVVLPNLVLGNDVFSNCVALTNVVFAVSVTNISGAEFFGCAALASVIVPTNVATIGDSAFQNCYNLDAVYFQGNAPAADLTVFSGDDLETNFYFPRNSGWSQTFAGRPALPILFACATNNGAITIKTYLGIEGEATVPGFLNGLPVAAVANFAFDSWEPLTNVVVGSNVTSIAGQAFVGCTNLLEINVDPDNSAYSSVDGVLFDKNQDAILYYPGGRPGSYTLPQGVTTISTYAFQESYGLSSLIVPASVTNIGTVAFNLDPELTAIYFEGDAPGFDWEAFYYVGSTVTEFYLPGMTGWDTDPGGLPIALWLPRVQTTDSSFGVQANQFGFNISWAGGQTVVVEACTNIFNPVWQPVQTNTLAGNSVYFSDPQWTNFPNRFYQIVSP